MIELRQRGETIEDYFVNYFHRGRNPSVRVATGHVTAHDDHAADWLGNGETKRTIRHHRCPVELCL